MVCVRVIWDVECDDVGCGEELRERRISEIKCPSELVIFVHIKPQNLHSESIRHTNDVNAHVTGTDNSDSLAREVEAAQAARREGTASHALVSVNDTAREREQ